MLRSIVGNRTVLSLAAMFFVGVGDGVELFPEVVCCPSCGAAIVVIVNLLAAQARTPDGTSKANGGQG